MEMKIRIMLDELLEEKGLSRYALAKRANIPYPTVDKYFKNKPTRYDSDIIFRICLALDCTPGDLIRLVETEDTEDTEDIEDA